MDQSAGITTSRDPSANPAAWHVTDFAPDVEVFGVTCRSATLCVGSENTGSVATSTNPAGAASTWKVANIDPRANVNPGVSVSVNCSPHGRCIAFDPFGTAFTSARPDRGRSSWSRSNVDAYGLTTASCPSMTLCVAADGYGRIAVGKSTRAH
ncbi:MAG TPA: hypothetical protein VGF93_12415 [Solirubrobacteraceae bacterium]